MRVLFLPSRETPAPRRWPGRPLARRAVLALLLLPAAACFERPIDEELELRFLAQGGLVVSSSIRIGKSEEGSAAMEERLARARRDVEEGNDVWTRELAALDPVSERLVLDRTEGVLTHAVRRAYLRRPQPLRDLLSRATGSVRLDSGEGWSEIALAPLQGARASEAERRRSADLLEDWAERIALYFERTHALYRYLDANPDRAEPCLAPLLSNEPSQGGNAVAEPTDEESSLIDPVQTSMKELVEMFSAAGGADRTPDEIVQLANDPFPTRIAVVVPGKVLETEGFVAEDGDRVAVPEGGLFGAMASLEGAWIDPDPLVANVRYARSREGRPFDLAAFAARPRTARGGATGPSVRRALERALTAATTYRVRWATAPGAPSLDNEGPDGIDWDALAPRPRRASRRP